MMHRLISKYATYRWQTNDHRIAWVQAQALSRMLKNVLGTEMARTYNMEKMVSPETFRKRMPVRTYSDLKPLWARAVNGETGILFRDKLLAFAMTSGTTGDPKLIPFSQSAMNSWRRLQMRALSEVVLRQPDFRFFKESKQALMLSARANIRMTPGGTPCGMVSGIYRQYSHPWFSRKTLPSLETMNLTDWDTKMRQILRECAKSRVGMLAGLPSILIEFLEFAKKELSPADYQRLSAPIEILAVSGMNYVPYRKTLIDLLGRDVLFLNLYASSEGFLGRPTWENGKIEGSSIQLNPEEYFYEFIEENDYRAGRLEHKKLLHELEVGACYVLLISNGSGAWSYEIGDVLRCVRSVGNPWFEIQGRLTLTLNIAGEKTPIQAIEAAVLQVGSKLGSVPREFTVTAERFSDSRGGGQRYVWILENNEAWRQHSSAEIAAWLDQALIENYRYFEFSAGVQIQPSRVAWVSPEQVQNWMTLKGKQRGHLKFPRISPDTKILTEIGIVSQ